MAFCSLPVCTGKNLTNEGTLFMCFWQTYYGLHGPLGSRLFDVIAKKDRDDLLLSFEEFLKAKVRVAGCSRYGK